MNKKKMFGQFFTIVNPFNHDAFFKWFRIIPKEKKEIIIEPFAGANNICALINQLKEMHNIKWNSFDIEPDEENNVFPASEIIQRDTIKDFPSGYYTAITNPPYLAKNSATRSGIDFPETQYDDLYKLALEVMLDNLEYVAAIIPESFINSGLFHTRLYAFISLTCKMFSDTECPVCLALFVREQDKELLGLDDEDFIVYRQKRQLGNYSDLKKLKPYAQSNVRWKFNDPNGSIGIVCIDNTHGDSIRFVSGEEIDPSKIKQSSRSITRVSGLPEEINNSDFISDCNNYFAKFRADTGDVFLTSFKGLRRDEKYRRRLDFANARLLMNYVVDKRRGMV